MAFSAFHVKRRLRSLSSRSAGRRVHRMTARARHFGDVRHRARAATLAAAIGAAVILLSAPGASAARRGGVLSGPLRPALTPAHGTVAAWGYGREGNLGDGNTVSSDVPVAVSGLSNITSISAGLEFGVALTSAGTLMAWGGNGAGELGDGSRGASSVPVAVGELSGVTAVSAGGRDVLALLSNGTVDAWGDNLDGQLGIGKTSEGSDVPVAVPGLSGVTAVAAGRYHSLALLSNGTVMAWGNNRSGQLGIGKTSEGSNVPVAIPGLSGVTAIGCGEFYSLALLSNGTVMAWGSGSQGQLGNGSTTSSDEPGAVHEVSGATAIAAGQSHALALLSNHTVMAWGSNGRGQLGDGELTVSDAPIAVHELTNVSSVAAGYGFSLATLATGTAKAWGEGESGQMGNGTMSTTNSLPVTVSNLSEATAAAAGSSSAWRSARCRRRRRSRASDPPMAQHRRTSVTIAGTNLTGATAVKFGLKERRQLHRELRKLDHGGLPGRLGQGQRW